MTKVMLVFGTRPEAIKMMPVLLELKKQPGIETVLAVTGQHRQMLDQVLEVFDVEPDYDLSIMKPQQNLFDITRDVLGGMKKILEEVKPDLVLVHGDTTTTFAASLAFTRRYLLDMWRRGQGAMIFILPIRKSLIGRVPV